MHKFNDDSPGKYNTGRRLDRILGTVLVYMENVLSENADALNCEQDTDCTHCKRKTCTAYKQMEVDNATIRR